MEELWKDYIYKGTTIGFQRCIQKNSAHGISIVLLRNMCMEKHEKNIQIKIDVKASYGKYDFKHDSLRRKPSLRDFGLMVESGYNKFSGYIENKSNNKVITSFIVVVKHDDNKDKNGEIKEEILKEKILNEDDPWTRPLIEPGDRHQFLFLSLTFRPERISREDKESLFSWHIKDIRGLDINLR